MSDLENWKSVALTVEAAGNIRHGESVILIFIGRWADFWKRTGTHAAWRFLLLSLDSKVTSARQTTAVKKKKGIFDASLLSEEKNAARLA